MQVKHPGLCLPVAASRAASCSLPCSRCSLLIASSQLQQLQRLGGRRRKFGLAFHSTLDDSRAPGDASGREKGGRLTGSELGFDRLVVKLVHTCPRPAPPLRSLSTPPSLTFSVIPPIGSAPLNPQRPFLGGAGVWVLGLPLGLGGLPVWLLLVLLRCLGLWARSQLWWLVVVGKVQRQKCCHTALARGAKARDGVKVGLLILI